MVWNLLKVLSGKQTIKIRPNDYKQGNSSFFDLHATKINGEKFHFSELKGKKTIIVNTASYCGFAQQFSLLEDFYRMYKNKVNILGFPCNDFFGQEPDDNKTIQQYCSKEFNISFPLFEKLSLKEKQIHPVYQWLINPEKNGWNKTKPDWNFCKYLIDENGHLLLYSNSRITPNHPEIINRIDS